MRWAVEVHNENKVADAEELIRESLAQLDHLITTFGKNTERLALIGSAHKRHAQISTGKSRQIALENMAKSYQAAWKENKLNPYPLSNMLTAQAALYWLGVDQDRASDYRENLDRAEELMEIQIENRPHDFWAAIGETDAIFLHYLIKGSTEGLKNEKLKGKSLKEIDLANLYSTAWQRYGTPRELGSIIEHLAFLVKIFEPNGFKYKYDSGFREAKRCEFFDELRSIAANLIETVNK